jgi:hypothetical protein
MASNGIRWAFFPLPIRTKVYIAFERCTFVGKVNLHKGSFSLPLRPFKNASRKNVANKMLIRIIDIFVIGNYEYIG